MPIDRSRLVRGAAAGALVLALLVGCTDEPAASPSASASVAPSTPVTATPSPTVTAPAGAVVAAPGAAATVVDAGAAAAALATSRAVFVSSPLVVVAAADDADGQLTAASVAVAVGAPVLLAGDSLAAEVERLGASRVVAVGDAVALEGVSVVTVASGASADELEAATGVAFGHAPRVKRGNAAAVAAVSRLEGEAPVALVGAGVHRTTESSKPTAPTAPTAPTTPSTGAAAAGATPSSSLTGAAGADALGATSSAAPSAAAGAPTSSGASVSAPTPARPVIPAAPGGLVALVGAGRTPVAALATLRAAGVPVVSVPGGDPRATTATVKAVAAAKPDSVIALGPGFGTPSRLAARVATARTGVLVPGGGQLVFPEGDGVRGKRYVALYGTPGSKALGVLGEQSVAKTVARATKTAKPYRALTKDTVVPMVEVIATIASASAGDDKDYSRERSVAELRPLVEAAHRKGLAVVLDLQPGRADFLTQAKRYEALLAMPNVGLALDPEWRLKKNQKHLRQIGSVKVAEVNRVGDWLAELTAERHLPQKMFVLHQFSLSMITDRSELDTSHDELAVLIHVDGQGSQPAKRGTWKALRAGAPDVHWGWKNFYDEDHPMLSPKKTYKVSPKPDLVTYQ